MKRRLTTILSADVVGYSRLMAADEAGTLASLKALRRELINRAMRLCPIYPGWYLYVLATACRHLGRNESAVIAFEAAIYRNSDDLSLHVGLASTLGELSREEGAKRSASEISGIDPDFSIKKCVEGLSYRDPAELARFEKGLRIAGLPE